LPRIEVLLARPELPLIDRMNREFARLSERIDRSVVIQRKVLGSEAPSVLAARIRTTNCDAVVVLLALACSMKLTCRITLGVLDVDVYTSEQCYLTSKARNRLGLATQSSAKCQSRRKIFDHGAHNRPAARPKSYSGNQGCGTHTSRELPTPLPFVAMSGLVATLVTFTQRDQFSRKEPAGLQRHRNPFRDYRM
jgi:hypothetical protein